MKALFAVLLLVLTFQLGKAEWDQEILSKIGISDQDVATFLYEQAGKENRELQGQQRLFDRCGRRTFCAEGLECNRAFLCNRCIPKACLVEQLADFKQSFDLERYMHTIMTEASLTDDMLLGAFDASGQRGRDLG